MNKFKTIGAFVLTHPNQKLETNWQADQPSAKLKEDKYNELTQNTSHNFDNGEQPLEFQDWHDHKAMSNWNIKLNRTKLI